MSVTFRLATEEDARFIGTRLRESDLLELERGDGPDPERATLESLRMSLIAWTGINAAGTPVMIFGAAPYKRVPGKGIVWLLATAEAQREARALLHGGRYYVGLMSRLFPELINVIDVENSTTRRWLRALGFKEGVTWVSPRGHPFIFIHHLRNSKCAT